MTDHADYRRWVRLMVRPDFSSVAAAIDTYERAMQFDRHIRLAVLQACKRGAMDVLRHRVRSG